MILRPRQKEFVSKCVAALKKHRNTLGIAPTGFGKTIVLSAITGKVTKMGQKKALILQHRDELVEQNSRKFRIVNPQCSRVGFYMANTKSWRSNITFGMMQTLARDANLSTMPPHDIVIVDEAHHIAADSYKAIIGRARELNKNVQLLGVTATPQRGDKKGLKEYFSNIADQVKIGELIAAGHLVRPRTLVVDIGVQDDLRRVRRTANDFDMTEVERIMDHKILNEKIIEQWKEHAHDRQTVVFCSTINHARHVTQTFIDSGVKAEMVDGGTPKAERAAIFKRIDQSITQVLVNVAVATEGWDCPPISCVVLLRPSSDASVFVQMVGRGLRTIDPELYPGIVKSECLVMDFGTSALTHGKLEVEAALRETGETDPSKAPKRMCPQCNTEMPAQISECPICGYTFTKPEDVDKDVLENFTLTEIDLLNLSPFMWESLFDDLVLAASAFDAWAKCVFYKGVWHSVGGSRSAGVKLLAVGERTICLARADDFLREHGDTVGAKKTKRWLSQPASPKQLQVLGIGQMDCCGLTKYRATCLISWKFNERNIRTKVEAA